MANGTNHLAGERLRRVGVVEEAVGGPDRVVALAALFPNVSFEPVGPAWSEQVASGFDVLIVPAEASSIEETIRQLKHRRTTTLIAVVLRDADVLATRVLVREGAADVLPAPVGEPALALSLERLLSSLAAQSGEPDKAGEVVAFLKAGGGVGATALAVQVATMLSARGDARVCIADLDLQFGVAGLYLDLPEAVSIGDLLGAGHNLADTPFDTALTAHRSGARLLAGPRELMPLETLAAPQIDGLLKGLRRNYPLTLIDLPSVWTAWTNRVLTLADRVVLVTHLSVPHIQLVKRQLQILATQKLDGTPLILVCNSVSPEQQSSVSIKSAEKALGRSFDVVLPEDGKLMTAAVNQGLELASIRRGAKLEKAVQELADKVSAGVIAAPAARKGW